MITIGLDYIGIGEVPGPLSNPEILEMAAEIGLKSTYKNDDIAWCGLYVGYVVKKSGRQPVKEPLWARNWLDWGEESKDPMLGDILIFERGNGGHVGFYIAEDEEAYHVLGGNQSDSVSIVRIKKDRLLGARRPKYNLQPASVKKYFLSPTGQLSQNEA